MRRNRYRQNNNNLPPETPSPLQRGVRDDEALSAKIGFLPPATSPCSDVLKLPVLFVIFVLLLAVRYTPVPTRMMGWFHPGWIPATLLRTGVLSLRSCPSDDQVVSLTGNTGGTWDFVTETGSEEEGSLCSLAKDFPFGSWLCPVSVKSLRPVCVCRSRANAEESLNPTPLCCGCEWVSQSLENNRVSEGKQLPANRDCVLGSSFPSCIVQTDAYLSHYKIKRLLHLMQHSSVISREERGKSEEVKVAGWKTEAGNKPHHPPKIKTSSPKYCTK